MPPTILTLIRHGHTEWNALGRYQGYAPIPLSSRGKAQAACLVGALDADPPVHAAYCSDLARCRQTVAPLAAALGLRVRYDPRLREIDYGNWQGLTRDEAAAWDAAAFEAYSADPENASIPGGENQRMLAGRVLAMLADMLAENSGRHILVVTHGGPIRAILRHYGLWQGGRPSGNASRTVLHISEAGEARLVLEGDIAHLPPELAPDPAGTTFIA